MSSYPKDDSRSIADGNTVLEPRAIDKQLRRIVSSPEFKATARQKKILQFVVEKTLEGQADEIKGYTVATSVFGRKETSPATFHDALKALAHAAIKEPECPLCLDVFRRSLLRKLRP